MWDRGETKFFEKDYWVANYTYRDMTGYVEEPGNLRGRPCFCPWHIIRREGKGVRSLCTDGSIHCRSVFRSLGEWLRIWL